MDLKSPNKILSISTISPMLHAVSSSGKFNGTTIILTLVQASYYDEESFRNKKSCEKSSSELTQE